MRGHSLGGAMGCQYVKNHEGVMEGLILLGAYPAGISDLSESDIDVISIYASEDGLSTVEKVNNAKAYLPDDTQYVLMKVGIMHSSEITANRTVMVKQNLTL